MRRFLLTMFSLSMAAFLACSSDEETASTTPPDVQDSGSYDRCSSFTGTGTTCHDVSREPCFPLCKAGGNFCVDAPDGGAVWIEIRDYSCIPDASPDAAPVTFEDASPGDADAGSPADAGDAGDAASNDSGM